MNITDDMLVAYLDGELSELDHKRVEKYLAENSDAAERVADWRSNDAFLKSAFSIEGEESSADLQVEFASDYSAPNSARWQQLTRYAIAACLFLAMGFGGGLTLSLLPFGNAEKYQLQVAGWAAEAHEIFATDQNRPGEFGVESSAQAESWLRQRVGVGVSVPDLSADQLKFVGIRLVGQGGEPAALMTFETANAQRVSVFVRSNEQPPEESGYWFFHGEDKTTCVWLNAKIAFSVTGELPDEQLKSIALKVVDSLGMGYARNV